MSRLRRRQSSPCVGFYSAVAGLLLGSSLLLADVRHVIPVAFTGQWAASPQACTSPGTDPLALRVERSRLVFADGPALVEFVSTEDRLKVLLQLRSPSWTGDPAEDAQLVEFELSAEGDRLYTLSAARRVASRFKCPDEAVTAPPRGP